MPVPENVDPNTGEILPSPPVAMTLRPQQVPVADSRIIASGVRQLAEMTDDEFQQRLDILKKGKARMRVVQRSLLDEGTDYGKIPNTKDKKTLFKSGAEKLAEFFQFATSYEIARAIGDGVITPTIHYTVKCFIHLGTTDGPIVHAGAGTANSWEVKYRYRNAGRTCPACKKDTIKKTKANDRYPAGYWCGPRDGGCGANFSEDNAELAAQSGGKKDNPDPYDMDNTFIKMAKKRAYVDAIIGATATSELFIQDIGDTGAGDHGDARGEPPSGHGEEQEFGDDPDYRPRSTVASSTKPPEAGAKKSSGVNTGSKRADALIDAFSRATASAAVEKLLEAASKWPEQERALLKEPYKNRMAELKGAS